MLKNDYIKIFGRILLPIVALTIKLIYLIDNMFIIQILYIRYALWFFSKECVLHYQYFRDFVCIIFQLT